MRNHHSYCLRNLEWVGAFRKSCDEAEKFHPIIESVTSDSGLRAVPWTPISPEVEYALCISRTSPCVGGGVDWVYIIDLDRLIFTVDKFAHFDLFRIPHGNGRSGEWISYLALDGRGYRCLNPHMPQSLLPAVYDCHLPSIVESFPKRTDKISANSVIKDMKIDIFESAGSLMAFQECAAQMTKGFISSYLQVFADAQQHHPSTAKFQEKAAFLLSLAAPGFYNSSDLGLRYYNTSNVFETSTSPHGTLFWFRQRLVVMTSHLDYENHLQAHIGDIVEYVANSCLERCVAILWSIRHVAVIDVTNFGAVVECSPVLPILAAFHKDDMLLTKALRLLAAYLSPSVLESADYIFERSQTRTKAVLPVEVLIQVIGYMDKDTYCTMGTVCKALRFHCIVHPIIGPFHLLGATGDRLNGSIENGPRRDIAFFCQMYSDEMQDIESLPEWEKIPTNYPYSPTSFFSFERYEEESLEFHVGPRPRAATGATFIEFDANDEGVTDE